MFRLLILLFCITFSFPVDASIFCQKKDCWRVDWIQNNRCGYDLLRLAPQSVCPYQDLTIQWFASEHDEVRAAIALYLCPLEPTEQNEVTFDLRFASGSAQIKGILQPGGQTILLYPADSDALIDYFWYEPSVRITYGLYDTTLSSCGFQKVYNVFYRKLITQER